MKNQEEIVSDLKGLINILNDGKVGYKEAIDNVKSENLKSTFLQFSNQRYAFAEELKAHVLQHGGNSENEEGGVLGALHRAWLDIKDAFTIAKEVKNPKNVDKIDAWFFYTLVFIKQSLIKQNGKELLRN